MTRVLIWPNAGRGRGIRICRTRPFWAKNSEHNSPECMQYLGRFENSKKALEQDSVFSGKRFVSRSPSDTSCQKIEAVGLALRVEISGMISFLSHSPLCAGKAVSSQSKKTIYESVHKSTH